MVSFFVENSPLVPSPQWPVCVAKICFSRFFFQIKKEKLFDMEKQPGRRLVALQNENGPNSFSRQMRKRSLLK